METDQTSLSKSSVIVAFLLIVLSSQTPEADANPGQCAPSSCGNIHNISYPFRLIDGPISCVDPSSHYNLSCENNNLTVLHLYSGKYHVQAINYNSGTIRVSDPGLQPNNCSSIPRYSISVSNFSFQDPYNYFTFNCTGNPAKCRAWRPVAFFKCVNRLNSSMYVDTAPCINVGGSRTNLARPESYGYVKVGTTNVAELEDGCSVEWMAIVNMYENDRNASYQHIHDALVYGFELAWAVLDTDSCRGWSFTQKCYQNKILGLFPSLFQYIKEQRYAALLIIGGFFVARFILGTPFVIWFLIYKWRRRHLSMYSTIEDFCAVATTSHQ